MAWHAGYMPVERKDSEEDGTSTTLLSIHREPKGLYFGIFPFIFHLFVFAIYTTVFYVFFGGFVTDGDCVGHLSLWCMYSPLGVLLDDDFLLILSLSLYHSSRSLICCARG